MSSTLRGRFDVQLHQVDERRAAGQEAHVGALLRRFRLRGRGLIAAAGSAGRMNSKVCIESVSCSRYARCRTCWIAATMLG